MKSTDVFTDLPALQAALRQKSPPEGATEHEGWETILLNKSPGFKDWLIWHHRILLEAPTVERPKETSSSAVRPDHAGLLHGPGGKAE